MGHPIYNFCHPADLTKLQATLNSESRYVPRSLKQNLTSTKVKHVYIYRVGREEDEEEEEEKRQSFYIRLKEKPLAKNDSPQ